MSGGTKTHIYITVDTEYAFHLARDAAAEGLGQCEKARARNYAQSIACETKSGNVGLEYQMDMLDAYGLTAVFFVDPMPALIWGVGAIAEIVQPIVARGHDVQLHVHSEWLDLAPSEHPLLAKIAGAKGRNICDFSYEQQLVILSYARDMLVEAGAPSPVAFRAGNYGANDDSLRALAALGLQYDSSHCPGIGDGYCQISLSRDIVQPVEHAGLTEVPAGCITNFGGALRHAQITALSAAEMRAAMIHARDQGHAAFTIVSHSFELLSRDRTKINRVVKRRFEQLCADIAALDGVDTASYIQNPPRRLVEADSMSSATAILPLGKFRSSMRIGEQVVSNMFYGGD